MTLDFTIGARRLRVVSVASQGEVDLDQYRNAERLVMLVRADEPDDGLGYHCFKLALGERGLLSSVIVDDLLFIAANVTGPADTAADWIRAGDVTVACEAAPDMAAIIAAVMVAACGATVGEAVNAVRAQFPDALLRPEEEIAVSVAVEQLAALRDLNRRRWEAVGRGESPWSVR